MYGSERSLIPPWLYSVIAFNNACCHGAQWWTRRDKIKQLSLLSIRLIFVIAVPSHYLNQCWLIVNWTPENSFHWNINQSKTNSIQENVLEDVVWKTAVILFLPQRVKSLWYNLCHPLRLKLSSPHHVLTVDDPVYFGHFHQCCTLTVPVDPIGNKSALAPNRRQAISWTKADQLTDEYMLH